MPNAKTDAQVGYERIIVAGNTGSGKTTLTAWLLSQGFSYLTDELVFLPSGSKHIDAFRRPLSIKAGGRAVLEQTLGSTFLGSEVVTSRVSTLVPAPQLGDKHPDPHRVVGQAAIVFPQYKYGAKFRFKPLTGSQAGLALMGHVLNARNLDGHGFSEVTQLARRIPAYRMSYSHFGQLEQWVQQIKTGGLGPLEPQPSSGSGRAMTPDFLSHLDP